MPELSKLVIEVDSAGVLKATGNLELFAKMGQKAGQSTDDMAKKMGAFQLIANKLPGPLNSIAAGLMGMVSPATAVAGALISVGEAAVKYVKESIDAFGKYETIKNNLEVVMGSAEQASKMFNELRREVSNTPFNVQQYGDAAATLQKFGVSSRELMPTLKMLGDLSAGSAEKFNNLVQVYAKMTSAEEASAMTMRQLASAGVPIQKLLDDIGRSGETSFEAISEALKKATQEGGRFYGTMEKSSKTLENMKGSLASLKEQNKALWAELSGIVDKKKWFNEIEYDAAYVKNILMAAKQEIAEIDQRIEDGSSSASDLYRKAELITKTLETSQTISKKHWFLDIGDLAGNIYNEFNKQKNEMQKILDIYKPLIEYDKQRFDLIEKQVDYLNKLKSSYSSAMDFVNEIYVQTAEGQAEKIQEQIDKLIQIRNNQMKVETGNKYNPSTNKWEQVEVQNYLGAEEVSKIDKAIELLIKKLENLNKTGNPFKDWVMLLAQATGYTNEIVDKLGGLKTVEKYAEEGIEAVMDRLLKVTPKGDFVYELLGLDKTDVLDEFAQKLRSLVQMMTEARITEPWDIVKDDSYKKAIALLQQYKEAASEAHFKNIIKELEIERSLSALPAAYRVEWQAKEQLESDGVINPSDIQKLKYIVEKGENYIADLTDKLKDAGMSTYDLAVKRLMLEQTIAEKTAQQALSVQKQIDYITNGYDFMGEIMTQIDDALRSIRESISKGEDVSKEQYGQYAGARAAQAGMNLIQGSDAGNFMHGMEMGGPIIGLINMFAGALEDVIGGMEGMDMILSPITNMLKQLEPLIKTLLLPLLVVGKLLELLGQGIMQVLNIITSGLFGQMSDLYDSLLDTNDQRKTEAERLRALNEQYAKLFLALKEQEEYYLQQRRHLNAEWAIENYQTKTVNDMILSPHGVFRTDPEDYIIATKHPENLANNGGAAQVYVTVINNTDSGVSTRESVDADGAKNIQIIIDKTVQSGLASGKYDNALDAVSSRRASKRVIP